MTDLKLASCQFSFSYLGNKYRMETVGLSSDSAAESGRVLGECKHLLGRMAENRGTEGGWRTEGRREGGPLLTIPYCFHVP